MVASRCRRLAASSLFACALVGCSDPDGEKDYCSADATLAMADVSDAADYRVELDTTSAFAVFSVGTSATGELADFGLQAGRISFHTDDGGCVASADHACSIELHQLALELGAMTVPTSSGRVHIDSLSISAEVPVTLVDAGSGYFLGAEAQMRVLASIQDHRDAGVQLLGDSASMNIDIPNRTLGIDFSMPLSLRASQDGSCVTASTQCAVVASARMAWNVPAQ